jgi:hygromycin-B 4-O-kinase
MANVLTTAQAQRLVARMYGNRAAGLSPLGAGEWSQAYAFDLDGQPAVIRFGNYVADFIKDQAMAAHGSTALPIPAVTEIGRTDTGYFAISERAPGQLLNDLDAASVRAALPALFAALDAIRDIDVSPSRGYGLWHPDGDAAARSWPEALLAVNQETERVPGWRAVLAGSPVGTGPFDEAYATLERLVEGLPADRHIVHGDLANRNVLIRGAKITAVIDWGNSLYGDYLYDAAWLIYWWPWFPQWQAIDIRAELNDHWQHHGGPPADLHRRLRAYLIHIGLDALSYNAFTGRWEDLARNASQVSELVRSANTSWGPRR